MPGDAGSAVVKVNFDIQYGNLDGLEARITKLENTPHTIKVKVEAADGQKGLDNLIKGLDNVGQNAFKSTAAGAKSTAKNISSVGKTADKATKKIAGISKEFGQITSDTDEYSSALKAVGKLYDRTAKKMSGMQDASFLDAKSRGNWESLTGYLKQVKELEEDIFNQKTTGQSFNDRYSALANGIQKEISAIHLKNEATSEATKSQAKGLAQQQALEQKISANRAKAAERSAEAQRVAQAKEKAAQDKAWTDRQSYIKKQEDAWNNQIRQIGKPVEQEIKRQEKIAEAQAKIDAKMKAPIGEDSKARWAAQRQVMADQLRIQKELNSWTAAEKSSKTSSAYTTLKESASEMARLNSELEKGTILRKDYEAQYQAAAKAAAKAESTIVKEGKDQLSFGDKLKNAFSSVSRYITPYMVMTKTIQTVKQMAQASMEIESAMTRIQIVTGATDTQMTQFFNTASNQAQELGKNITDVAGSIETFSRLGFSLDEAENLSKFATVMSNVADTSIDEATTGLTSIIKGFGLEASDAEHVSDVLIDVGQKYAISASELMQAFERGGAALHASGASFEESAALFAATNAALQNASTTGTMWKTVSARLRGATTELSEMGEETDGLAQGLSKYRDELIQLSGVDIMKNATEYKNPYQIFTELAQAWDNINGDPAKARVAEILGGTRQLSGIMSTITNIKDAMGAYETATNSAGVATKANDKYMETTAAHLGQLKASFQELSYDTLNGDLMKGFIDFGKGSLNVIDAVIDKIGLLGTTLSAVAIGRQIKSFAGDMKEGFSALQSAQGLLKPSNFAFLGVTAGITAIVAAYKQYQKVQQEQNQQANEAADEFQERSKLLTDYADRVHELRTQLAQGELSESDALGAKKELLEIQNKLNESYQSGAENLSLLTGQVDEQVQAVRDLNYENAINFMTRQGGENGGIEDAIAAMEGGVGEKIPFSAAHSDAYLGQIFKYSEEGQKVLELAESYGELFDTIESYGNSGEINLYFRGNAEEAQTVLRDFTKDVRALADVGESDMIDSIFNQSTKALNNADAILSTYKKIYDTYKESQLLTDEKDYRWKPRNGEADTRKAIDWINDYRKAVEAYNDALLSGDPEKIAEAKSSFEYIDQALTGLVGLGGKFSNYSEMIQEIRDQVQESMAEINDLAEIINNPSDSARDNFLQRSIDRIKSLNMTADDLRENLFDIENGLMSDDPHERTTMQQAVNDLLLSLQMLEDKEIDIYDDDGKIKTDVIISALEQEGALAEQTAEQVQEATSAIDIFNDYQSTLQSAIDSSRSATGLNTEQIKALTEAYKDLDSFDPAKLFENTLNGVHLNNEELKRLNAEIEQSRLAELARQLADQYSQYNELRSQGADTSAIEAEIAATQQLMAQYEGLASAYNAWLNAKSGPNERDTYEGIGAGYKEMEKIKDAGWYGDPALNAWLDMVLNPSARTGDAEADWARLGQTIADTGHSILDYWQYDSSGNLVSDGLFMFLDDVNHVFGDAYSTVRDGYNVWDFTGNKLQEVADTFGLTTEAVQSFERALVDTGGAVIFDNTNLDILTGSLNNLNTKTGILDDAGISLDFDVSEMSASDLQAKIQELDGLTAEIDIEADGGEDALAMMEALQFMLDQEYYVKLNTETGGGLDAAAQKIERVKQLIAEANGQGINVHTFVDGNTEVQQLASEIASLPEEVQIAIGVSQENLNNPAGIASQFADNSINIPVNYTVHADPEAEYADQNPSVTYGINAPAAPSYPNQNPSVNYKVNAAPAPSYPNLQRSVTYSVHTVGGGRLTKASGTMTSIARADGSMVNAPWNWKHAYADGKVALDQNELALVNELGTESIIRDGQWMLLPGGMHQEALRKGDIILSAAQTKALIQTGKASGHGRAYADGSILSNAYTLGSTAKRRTNSGSTTGLGGNSSSSNSGGSNKKSGGNNNNNNESEKDEEPEIFDWIELAIDRIERVIKQLGVTAKSTFKTLTTRLEASASEIATVTDEIELQQKAYDRYIQQANSVGLSEDLAKRVREGAIDINEYDKETQELINDYQEWYEKALDCDDAIQQLHEDLGQLYEDRFKDTKDDFDAQLDLLKHLTNTYENGMDDIEARGYLATTKYYEAMRKVENKNIDLMNKELDALIEKMSQAVNSGAIKEGSQAWYEMQQEINDVKEAIQEAETSVIDLGNKIHEVLWDRFDYLQDRISQINDESEFMIELLSHSDMHTDTGLFTNEGLATLGLHAQTYDVLMNKADRYAKEVEKINKEIANDPNNTILLEQRQEWIEAQRESILNAEDEKDAMISLVEEGIQLELSALNKLINKYKDSMDQAKSLYDYQKKINEQAQKVTSIQKQLRAYTGDDSEETRAITQKLTVDLSDAMEKLEESQYQKQISDQKAMLSNLYDAYELILNQRLDNVDALMSDLIQMVNLNSGATQDSINALKEANGGYVNVINGQIYNVGGSNSTWFDTLNHTTEDGYGGVKNGVALGSSSIIDNDIAGYKSITDTLTSSVGSVYNANSEGYKSIKDTMNGAAMDVGYTISEEMKSIWSDSGNANRVVALYGDLVNSGLGTTNGKLDTVNEIIAGIATNVASMVQKSDTKATATVKATTPTTKTNTAAKPVTPPPTPTVKKAEAPKKADGRTDQEKYGVAIAIWNGLQGWGAGQDRKNKLEAKGFNYNEIQGIVNKIKGDILSNTWSGKYYGITGNDISKYAYNKFKSGGIVDYTGLAQVDGTPGRPEAFLNAEDTKNFTILKDTLRAIMNGKASLSGSPVGLGLLSGLSGIGRPQGLRNSTIGDITYQINIPIDHVTDYDDFVNKMRSDTKFERLIQSMTIEQLTGQSSISKNKYKW